MSEYSRALAVLAAEHRAARAPVSVERAVMAEFEASRRRRVWRVVAAGAVAALLAVGVIISRPKHTQHSVVAAVARLASPEARVPASVGDSAVTVQTRPSPHEAKKTDVSVEEPFVAIPFTVPLAPEERATVMRVALSPSAIAAIGFPLPAIDPGNVVEADLLVGEDGRAHAVRIIGQE